MRRRTRTPLLIAATLGVATASVLAQAPPASAEPECLTGSSDFDRDGTPDIAVGVPGGSGRAGAVQVRLSNKGKPVTTTVTGAPGFGTATTTLSSYAGRGDVALCSQLVVGSPDESARAGRPAGGVVHVYTYSTSTKSFVRRATFHPESPGMWGTDQPGARFGAALAAEQRTAGGSQPPFARLFVGSPNQEVWDSPESGQITSFRIDDARVPEVQDPYTLDFGDEILGDSAPPSKAHLGASLSVSGNLVVIGVPGQTVAGAATAGSVIIDQFGDVDGFLPRELSQASPGVPGTAEAGDRFGTSVHLVAASGGRAPTLLVGTPGEDVGRLKDAGSVTVLRVSRSTGKTEGTVRTVDQNSAGMAGSAEADDQLGAAVSSVRYGSSIAYLVGAPGEDVGKARDAGMVQTIGNGKGWTQSTAGVPGTAEAGDRMGASLAGSPATGAKKPLVGIPGEDLATGAVLVGLPIDGGSVSYLKGTRIGNRYGYSVAP
ncbi:hypothetical protein GCM10022204_09930 [Microlunatus aurantiacus]|uniref:FG-GAP repeat-containing protein n=1 Tax=Microlunatus aurantiacus TaxID=446786 RepID=A0ABP7CT91_9ACTN